MKKPYNNDEWFLLVLCLILMGSGPLGYFLVTCVYPFLMKVCK